MCYSVFRSLFSLFRVLLTLLPHTLPAYALMYASVLIVTQSSDWSTSNQDVFVTLLRCEWLPKFRTLVPSRPGTIRVFMYPGLVCNFRAVTRVPASPRLA